MKKLISLENKFGGLFIGETIYSWEIDLRILWFTLSLGIVKGL